MLQSKQRLRTAPPPPATESAPQGQPGTPPNEPRSRYGEGPAGARRAIGIGATLLIQLAIVVPLLLEWRTAPPLVKPASLTLVDLAPISADPELPAPPDEDLPPTQPTEPAPQTPAPQPAVIPKIVLPLQAEGPTAPAEIQPQPTDPPVKRTALPPPNAASSREDSWEGRVLAQLNSHRRYPRLALARRQEGVPWVRFVIDRAGRVLSVRLERSSGVPALDHEAVQLPKRAQPFPRPPEERADKTIELVAPVEFFLR